MNTITPFNHHRRLRVGDRVHCVVRPEVGECTIVAIFRDLNCSGYRRTMYQLTWPGKGHYEMDVYLHHELGEKDG